MISFARQAGLAIVFLMSFFGVVWAQGTSIALGGLNADPSAPVEVRADSLSVDQATGEAIFEGNVVIGQGALRIAAGRVEIVYGEGQGQITRLSATGGVTFTTDTEAAEAERAEYDISGGVIVLSGSVLLTQGASAISADRMVINLESGTAQISGNVRTLLQQSGN